MGRTRTKHPPVVRFSPFSFLCLMVGWMSMVVLAFYLGMQVGRENQSRESRRAYQEFEKAESEDAFPALRFSESLLRPDPGDGPAGDALDAPEGEPPHDVVARDERPDRPGRVPAGDGPDATAPTLPPQTPAATPDGFFLQVASFRDPTRARRFVDWLRKEGYPSLGTQQERADGKAGLYRVYVGPFTDRTEASRVKTRLEGGGRFPGILIRSGKREGVVF